MVVPVLLLVFMIIVSQLSRRYFKTANRPLFLIILSVALLLFSGLRGSKVGVDTPTYIGRFYDMVEMSYSGIKHYITASTKDPLYYILSWIFSRVFKSGQMWIAFVSFVYLLGVTLLCYWESPDYAFSMLFFYCMGFFFFSMTGLRQTIAMGLTLMSYIFVVKRKLIPFAILMILAYYIHKSAMVFILIYPLAYVRTGWTRLLIVTIFFIIVLAYKDTIGTWLLDTIPDLVMDNRIAGYLQSTKGYTASGFVIQLAMFIFTLRYRKAVVADVPHRETLYNMAFLGLIFQAAAISIAEFFRISMYFSVYNMVLIPICVQYESDQRMFEMLRTGIMLVLVAYFFYSTLGSCGITPYYTFWQ